CIPMKLRRILSCMMALLLVCSLPVSALADTWYLEDGDITVNASADESGTTTQTVTQGETSKGDSAPVITQRDSETPTTNTITITAKENASANVTLDGVNIDVGGTGKEPEIAGEAAVRITGEGDVTIELDGENTVQSGFHRAGVEKDDANSTGNLTITDENGTAGSLNATGGALGAGIGGGTSGQEFGGTGTQSGNASNITITGSAKVTAQGGFEGAGIGGGDFGSGSDITITGSAEVTANGGTAGSGIGGGAWGSGSDITITGSAEVTANGGEMGSGIGGGYNFNGNGTGSNITVSGNAQVKAQGGNSYYSEAPNVSQGAGAAIGDGGGYIRGNHPEAVKGKDAEVTTDAPQDGESYGLYVGELNEGWVATYAPGEDMDTENPGSLTYQGGIKVPGATPVAKQEPTCTEAGHEAGYEVDGVVVAVTIPAKGHNVPGGYTPLNNATCTTLGTMSGYCVDCQTTVTVTDPNSTLKDHTFTTYTPDPDNLATCTEDGTKTAVCDVCKNATDTIPDPAKGHSMGDFTTYKAATCTEAGEERAYCDHCDHYESREIPELGHSFTDYVSDGNATYTEDGTKTAHCDHPGCTETHTIPDPGSKLVRKEAPQTAPLYRVVGQDGKDLACKTEQSSGVLTITVDADFATLTGSLGGMKTLKAQGINTIVFVTGGATSTFVIEDLLAQSDSGDTYQLTHDGEAVSFTIGETETDITGILVKP
ncbi:MAG: hypothetical protein ACI3XG_00300, partial [Faecousia sp.]